MDTWQTLLKSDPTDWLLEPDNPSVRYFALREVLDRPPLDAELQAAQRAIMQQGPVPAILARQEAGGYWGRPEDFYIRSKYRGTVWSFLLLAELGADGDDPRVRRAAEFLLASAQDRISLGFAYKEAPLAGGDHSGVIPCLTGNLLFSLVRLGYLSDPRVQGAIQWIVRYQRFDDGAPLAPRGWPYDLQEKCWGKHTCLLGIVKTLRALAEIPPDQRSEEAYVLIQMAAEFLLRHHIFRRSHDLAQVAAPRWLEPGFALMWDTDALEMLDILTHLGYRDARMQEAVDWVASKQDDNGRWSLERSFNDRMLVNIERKGKPSKWVTLRALSVLKRYHTPPE